MGNLDNYDQETLQMAFWLQGYLYRNGIEGIHFMEKAEEWAENNAADITADRITQELNRL